MIGTAASRKAVRRVEIKSVNQTGRRGRAELHLKHGLAVLVAIRSTQLSSYMVRSQVGG